jgi:H+/Cl- antiporter ClcA
VRAAPAARVLAQWTVLGALVGVACGGASALFLTWLDHATATREANEWLVYLLPVAGLLIGLGYERWGTPIRGGNNLVIDTLHAGSARIPLRMAPMVLLGTVLTHLFGGSAGREGTAVQMGASLADDIAHRFRVGPELRRAIIAAGIAGGFGSVFGTPVAGVIFGLEVLCIGRLEYEALVPALVASLVGDAVTRALGVGHAIYPVAPVVPLSLPVAGKLVLMGAAMAAVTVAFVELTYLIKVRSERHVRRLPLRLFVGGIVIVGLWKVVGTSAYLGLGVPTILRAFEDPNLPVFAFAFKLLFTAVTLGCGFIGGEVTPLFFVGATLGSVLAGLLGLPLSLGAGLGMAAVFGAAANTPLALSIMVVELLGAALFPHVLIVAVVAFLLSGHRGIYPAQRLVRRKHGAPLTGMVALRDLREAPAPPGEAPPPPGPAR